MAPKGKKTTTKKEEKKKDNKEDLTKRFRNFVFTLNNYTDEIIQDVQMFFTNHCKYGVYGKEVGESGTPHLQGYCELTNQLSLKQLKSYMPTAHFEPGRAPNPKARAGYCKKGNAPKKPEDNDDPNYYLKYFDEPGPGYEGYEFGKESISTPRVRTDLAEMKEAIYAGKLTYNQILDTNPMAIYQYGRPLRELEDRHRRMQFRCGEAPECIWYYGGYGVGKSHRAFVDELASIGGYHPDKVYDWDLEQEFQCGYDGQEVVIVNEYKGPHQIKLGVLLKLLDKWPMKLKRKSPLAAREFTSKKVIITSIFHPTEIQWNLHSSDNLDQLTSRLKIIKLEGENRREAQPEEVVQVGAVV